MLLSTGYLSYEDARAITDAAPKGHLHLPKYTGGSGDLSYLHQYVVQNAAKLYGVSTAVFSTATVFSTTLLRDFVHRAVYDTDSKLDYTQLQAAGKVPDMTHDVAAALRLPAYGICGLLGWQMYTVFQACGFQTTRISSIDTAWPRPSGATSGHVTTEVFLKDYGKFALQDATYNAIWLDASGVPQSYHELRTAVEVNHQTINPVYGRSYVNAQIWGGPLDSIPNTVDTSKQIDDLLRKTWFQVPYTWTTSFNTFTAFTSYIDMAPGTGRQYATTAAALNDLAAQKYAGATWENAAAAIRAKHDVTGFRILSTDSGLSIGDWLTVKVAGGYYLSFNLHTGQALNGSLDQLLAEGSHRGPANNPGVSLAAIFGPEVLMDAFGGIAYDWAAQRLAHAATAVHGTNAGDILNGGAGAQLHAGGLGNDIYYVNDPGDLVLEYAGGGYDRVFASESYTLSPGSQVEYLAAVTASATTAIDLIGNKFANTLIGNAGNNMLNGGGAADVMSGGLGKDTYYVDNAHDVVNEFSGQGYDRVYTSVNYALLAGAHVEELDALSRTDSKPLNLTGSIYAQTITGNAGANVIDGRGGGDTLTGLKGDDVYIVHSGTDKVVEAVGGGYDFIWTFSSYFLAENVDVEVLRAMGSSAIDLIGNSHQNILVGNAAANSLNGQGGGDTMRGLGGNDTYHVWSSTDWVVELAGQGNDTVVVHANWIATAGSEIETIETDNGNINITGNEFANAIAGGTGINILDGGLGNDVFTGGAGADVFAFSTAFNAASNVDTIMDFTPGTDTIAISSALLGGVTVKTDANGILDPAAFVVGTGATTSDQHFIYDDTTGELSFDDGASHEVIFAKLAAHLSLSNADLKII